MASQLPRENRHHAAPDAEDEFLLMPPRATADAVANPLHCQLPPVEMHHGGGDSVSSRRSKSRSPSHGSPTDDNHLDDGEAPQRSPRERENAAVGNTAERLSEFLQNSSRMHSDAVDDCTSKELTLEEQRIRDAEAIVLETELFWKVWFGLSYRDPSVEKEYRHFRCSGHRWPITVLFVLCGLTCVLLLWAASAFLSSWLGIYLALLGATCFASALTSSIVLVESRWKHFYSKSASDDQVGGAEAEGGSVAADVSPSSAAESKASRVDSAGAGSEWVTAFCFAHELLCCCFGVCVAGVSCFFYDRANICVTERLYGEDPFVNICVSMIPAVSFASQVAMLLATYCRAVIAMPLLCLPPVALFVPRLEFGDRLDTLQSLGVDIVIQALFTLCCCLVAYLNELKTKAQFEDSVRVKAAAKSALRLRARLDISLERMLPRSIWERMHSGAPLVDVADAATVVVCEISDFARWSTTVLPTEVVSTVGYLYAHFDVAAGKFGVDKGKAAGDRYLVTSGLIDGGTSSTTTTSQSQSAELTVLAVARAIDFSFVVGEVFAAFNHRMGSRRVEDLRYALVVHTGPLAGAVLGRNSLTYEVFGPALDVAAQMLPFGQVSRLNTTTSTANSLLSVGGTMQSGGDDKALTTFGGLIDVVECATLEEGLQERLVTFRKRKHCSVVKLVKKYLKSPNLAHAGSLSAASGFMSSRGSLTATPGLFIKGSEGSSNMSVWQYSQTTLVQGRRERDASLSVWDTADGSAGQFWKALADAEIAKPSQLQTVDSGKPSGNAAVHLRYRVMATVVARRRRQQLNMLVQRRPSDSRSGSIATSGSSRNLTISTSAQITSPAMAALSVAQAQHSAQHTTLMSVDQQVESLEPGLLQSTSLRRVSTLGAAGFDALNAPTDAPNISFGRVAYLAFQERMKRQAPPSRTVLRAIGKILIVRPFDDPFVEGEFFKFFKSVYAPWRKTAAVVYIVYDLSFTIATVLDLTSIRKRAMNGELSTFPLYSLKSVFMDYPVYMCIGALLLAVANLLVGECIRRWVAKSREADLDDEQKRVAAMVEASIRQEGVNSPTHRKVDALPSALRGRNDPLAIPADNNIGIELVIHPPEHGELRADHGGDMLETSEAVPPADVEGAFDESHRSQHDYVGWASANILTDSYWRDAVLLMLLCWVSGIALCLFPINMLNNDNEAPFIVHVLITFLSVLTLSHTLLVIISYLIVMIIGNVLVHGSVLGMMWIVTFLAAVTGCLAGTHYREYYERDHFEALCFSVALLKASEDELDLQRALHLMILPPQVLGAAMKQANSSTAPTVPYNVFYQDMCTLEIRFDHFAAMMIGDPAASVDKADRALSFIELLMQRACHSVLHKASSALTPGQSAGAAQGSDDECLPVTRVGGYGDSILFAGPLSQPEVDDADKVIDAIRVILKFVIMIRQHQALARINNIGTTSLGSGSNSNSPSQLLTNHPVESSYLAMSMIACFGSSFGALLGSRAITFNLIGFVARQSSTLLRAAPPGFVGSSESFQRMVLNSKLNNDGGKPVSSVFGEPERWRVRGSGVLTVYPFTTVALPRPSFLV